VGSSTSRVWSFRGAAPLRLSALTPATGSFIPSATPRLSVDVSSGAGGVAGTFTVGTSVVRGVFDAARGQLVATAPVLADETRYNLKATVTDASAKSVSIAGTFNTRLYTSGASAQCVACHSSYPASHPVADCDSCHHHGAFYGQKCSVCHATRPAHDTTKLYRALCTDCHGVGDPYVPEHPADLDERHESPIDFTSCAACHVRSVSVEHPLHTDADGHAYDCATCHAATVSQKVKDAVAASQTGCFACHDVAAGGHEAQHSWPASTTPFPASGGTCAGCHAGNVIAEHAKASASSAASGCVACHPAPRGTITGTWGKSCVTAGCHVVGSQQAMHGNMTAKHTPPSPTCWNVTCHGGISDLAALHSTASTTVAGNTLTSCGICHAPGRTASADCQIAGCHVAPHAGLSASLHTSTDGYDFISAGMENGDHGLGDGEDGYCSGCHSLSILPLHANNCGVCHEIGRAHV